MNFWKSMPMAMAILVMQGQLPLDAKDIALTQETVPLYRVTVVQGSAKAINYRNLKSSTKIDLKGTVLSPHSEGVAAVKSKDGGIHITAKFKKLSAASTFGGEFLTYVMWGISPEGRATNLGEVLLKNGEGELKAIVALQTFGLVVTAEPYFAVSQPSDVVVMENAIGPMAIGKVELIDAKYELLKRGQYTLNLEAMEPISMDKKTPFVVFQARNAVRIARATGAADFAPEAYGKAQNYLRLAENDKGSKKTRLMMARESVQRAEDARLISVQKQEAERITMERNTAQVKLDEAKRQVAAAVAAEKLALKETERAATENEGLRDRNESLRSTNDDLRTKNEDIRTKLMVQLNGILQTRATARGLIVNMSGVLFQNGKAVLLPPAREKLAKIAGILSTHKGLKIEADGYTDSNGGDELNQRLSEERARNTMDFLVSQGVPSGSITHKGFGKENPIASNETEAGRQENRRVELVVSGEGLMPPKDAGI
ncbi:MAG: OmpA family protein [Holophaga sp.]|nr:OmpA family protein [Holophaga sp.]